MQTLTPRHRMHEQARSSGLSSARLRQAYASARVLLIPLSGTAHCDVIDAFLLLPSQDISSVQVDKVL